MRMCRFFAFVLIAACWISQIDSSAAEPAATGTPPRSALIAKIVERFADGYSSFCFVGKHISADFKYRNFDLPLDFYVRFVDGQFFGKRINGLECPTEAGRESNCYFGCVTNLVFDMADLGAPTPWTPWPRCEVETISFLRGPRKISNKEVMLANIYRQQLDHNYLSVVELAPCSYLIYDEIVIE